MVSYSGLQLDQFSHHFTSNTRSHLLAPLQTFCHVYNSSDSHYETFIFKKFAFFNLKHGTEAESRHARRRE